MNLPDTLRPFGRRWYVALPLLLLTIAGSIFVASGVSPGHTVTAAVIVLPPTARGVDPATGVEAQPINPLLSFNSSTLITTQALTVIANGPAFRQRLEDFDGLAAYAVAASERQPIIRVSVESKDRDNALATAARVVDELNAELVRQQGAFPPSQQLVTQVLSQPSVLAVDNSRLRALVVALGVGLVASASLTFLVDAVALSRSSTVSHRRNRDQPGPRSDGEGRNEDSVGAQGREHDSSTNGLQVGSATGQQ